MLRISIRIRTHPTPLIKPNYALYIYTWATGSDFYTKEISYRTTAIDYESTEQKAIEMITKPLTQGHTKYPISVGGIENWTLCANILKTYGFKTIKTHQLTEAEDRILNRVFWTSHNYGADYETEQTRHEKDPFGIF